MVLHQGALIGVAQPVGVGLEIPVAVEVLEGVAAVLHEVLHILLGVHHLRDAVQALGGQLVAVGDLAFSLAPAGRDHDHAVAGLGAVDGGGGAVLEDFHRLDVVGVDAGDGIGPAAVHDIQRIGRTVGGDAADLDGRRGARAGGGGHDLHAGRLALQGGLRRGDRTVLDVLALHLGDGSREVGFLLDAVADDDGLFQHFGIRGQSDVDRARFGDDDLLRGEAHGGEDERRTRRHGDGIVAVKVRHDAVGGAFLEDTRSDHRHVLVIDDCSRDGHPRLGRERKPHQERQPEGRQSFQCRITHFVDYWLIG